MLRNVLLQRRLLSIQTQSKYARNNAVGRSGSVQASTRQAKIMNKLFGNRITGSKKRWYPHADVTSNGSNVGFQASQFGKPLKAKNGTDGKNIIRRMSVLNKLFMSHITDLLATGEASATIVGCGMQVTRVKISPDFACINVYWLGSNETLADATLETKLQECSGRLRHELSQLRLMGEVPRIRFVRDRLSSNINQIETLLRSVDFDKLNEMEKQQQQLENLRMHPEYDVAQSVRQEFYGNYKSVNASTDIPGMRHDVLGLDHKTIMSKIQTKLRKSKQAWEQYNKTAAPEAPTHLDCRLAESVEKSEKFAAYLAKKHERRQTPKRKKYNRELENWPVPHAKNADDVSLLIEQQQRLSLDDDYIVEEQCDMKK